jgi:aspartyl protease family protein
MVRIFMLATIVSGIAVAVPKVAHQLEQEQQAAAAQPAPQAAAMEPEIATIAYTSGRDVVLEATTHGHFIGKFKINGRSINGLIDTGASTVALNRSTAQKLGVSITPGMFTQLVTTANGAVKAARVELQTMEISSIRVRNVEALVLEDKALGGLLVGMSFLNQLSSFQARDGKLILTP